VANIHSQHNLEQLKQKDVPIVRVDNFVDLDIPSVFPDDTAIGKLAADYFLSRNFSNFAAVTYPEEPFGQIRAKAFSTHTAPSNCQILEISDRWEEARLKEAIESFLRKLPPQTALFAVNDDLATIIIYHARLLKLKIPSQLAVLGAGNTEFTCRKAMIDLSSIRLPDRNCGYKAAEMLQDILDGKKVTTKTLRPIDIVTRTSTDHFTVEDKIVAQALRLIHAKSNKPITIDYLTRVLSINRRTLERRFRKSINKSPLEEVMLMRMSRAKRLLEHTNLTIIQISHDAGFPDLKSMGAQFQKRDNMSPETYRNNTRIAD